MVCIHKVEVMAGVREYLHDWRVDLLLGAISAAVAFGGGLLELVPGWLTAAQGVVAGAFLNMAAIHVVGVNAWVMDEVMPDEDV